MGAAGGRRPSSWMGFARTGRASNAPRRSRSCFRTRTRPSGRSPSLLFPSKKIFSLSFSVSLSPPKQTESSRVRASTTRRSRRASARRAAIRPRPLTNRLIDGIWPGSGVAVLDFDQDGDEDLFVGDGVRSILYQNDGQGHFTDVTERAGLAASDSSGIAATGVAAGDVDGDGYPGSRRDGRLRPDAPLPEPARRHVRGDHGFVRHRHRGPHALARVRGRERRRQPRPFRLRDGRLLRSDARPSVRRERRPPQLLSSWATGRAISATSPPSGASRSPRAGRSRASSRTSTATGDPT